jgi:hypothetical protein
MSFHVSQQRHSWRPLRNLGHTIGSLGLPSRSIALIFEPEGNLAWTTTYSGRRVIASQVSGPWQPKVSRPSVGQCVWAGCDNRQRKGRTLWPVTGNAMHPHLGDGQPVEFIIPSHIHVSSWIKHLGIALV